MRVEWILPTSVKISYNYIKVDEIYVATISIIKYMKNIEFLQILDNIMGNSEITVSFHIEKQDTTEILKKLTSVIATTKSEIKSTNENQIDNNYLHSIKSEAEEIRKQIQINNEQIYLVSTYIQIFSFDEKTLLYNSKNIINKLYSKDIIARPNNFKQKEGYIACLPILSNSILLSKYTTNLFTESALANIFPFYSRDIFEKTGAIMGKANNHICAMDILSSKNMNYNMCVFGSSGAGKSYFIKLHILRNLYNGVKQIIIDPEGEYEDLVTRFNGHIYTENSYNPFEICETFAKCNTDFLSEKILQIKEYLVDEYGIPESIDLEKVIRDVYLEYSIQDDLKSLYTNENAGYIYVNAKYKNKFPTIKDLYVKIQNEQYMTKDIKEKFTKKIEQQSNNIVNVKKEDKLFCFSFKDKTNKAIKHTIKHYIPKIYEIISEKTIIYFDELWKCISMGENEEAFKEIYNLFKTLRKRKAGVVAISQDISDILEVNNGNFGKSILNNSYTKVLFKMDYVDIRKINEMVKNNQANENKVMTLERGVAIVKQGNSCFELKIEATEYENSIIEGAI